MHVIHDLKTWPEFFLAADSGRKKAEFRVFDRNFKVGDLLCLREWGGGNYTGRRIYVLVSHILLVEAKASEYWAMLSFERFKDSASRPKWTEIDGWRSF